MLKLFIFLKNIKLKVVFHFWTFPLKLLAEANFHVVVFSENQGVLEFLHLKLLRKLNKSSRYSNFANVSTDRCIKIIQKVCCYSSLTRKKTFFLKKVSFFAKFFAFARIIIVLRKLVRQVFYFYNLPFVLDLKIMDKKINLLSNLTTENIAKNQDKSIANWFSFCIKFRKSSRAIYFG